MIRRLMDHSLTGEEHMYSPQKCNMSKCKAFQKSDAGTVRSSSSTEILKETDSFYRLTRNGLVRLHTPELLTIN